jgi:hypothetical protein
VPRITLTTSLLIACVRLGLAIALSLLIAAPVRAADWAYQPFDQPPATYTGDFGLRFWYGSSTTAKNLYDNSGAFLVSRLTYGSLSIFAAEAYARFDLNRRWFLKGYVGGGTLRRGNLKDEDFPPAIVPYSATFSAQEDGSPSMPTSTSASTWSLDPTFAWACSVAFIT